MTLHRQRLAKLPDRLHTAWRNTHARRVERLASGVRELHAVSPLATMQRGYSVLRRPLDQEVIRGIGQFHPGDRVEALLADGSADLRVERVGARSTPDDTRKT